MFVNKKLITSLPNVVSRSARSSLDDDFVIPFKTENDMKKPTFDRLLNEVFLRLEDVNNNYYVEQDWLYSIFKKDLKKQESILYNNLYEKMKTFYKYHPFDTIEYLSKQMSEFFKKWKIQNVTQIPEWAAIVGKDNGQQRIANLVFHKLFINFIVDAMINKIGTKGGYAKFAHTFRQVLKIKISDIVKKVDSTFDWKNYRQLSHWIASFNHESLKLIKGQSIYDQYFIQPKKFDLSEADYVEILSKFLDDNLVSFQKKIMQSVLYYIFEDLTSRQEFQFLKVLSSTHKDAKNLISDIRKDHNPFKSLQIFLPGISKIINKYNFHWKSSTSSSGLVVHQTQKDPLLTLDPSDLTTYSLKFVFRFVADAVPDSINNKYTTNHIFKIPIKKEIPLFDKAKNVIAAFKNDIEWHLGYKGFQNWSEKDIVDWISDFHSYKDILNTLNTSTGEISITKDWANFSPTIPILLNLYLPPDKDFELQIEPIVKFKKDSDKIFGDIAVYLRLTQIAKVNSEIIKSEDILIKPPSQILSMIDVTRKKMKAEFPIGLNFESWQKNHFFWINEFLKSDGNFTSYLKEYSDLQERSNYPAMLTKLNQLFLDFTNDYPSMSSSSSPTLSSLWSIHMSNERNVLKYYINDSSFMSAFLFSQYWIGKKYTSPNLKIKLGLEIKDTRFKNKWLWYEAIIETLNMNLFGKIESGPFRGRLGLDLLYFDIWLKRLVVLPNSVQPTPSIGSYLDEQSFKFRILKDDKILSFPRLDEIGTISLVDIRKEMVNLGFQNITFGPVKKLVSSEVGITMSYEIHYHDFVKGGDKIRKLSYDISIEFDNVSSLEIQKGYDDIIDNLSPIHKQSTKLLDLINKSFSTLKDPNTNKWRNNVEKKEYNNVIKATIDIIKSFIVNKDVISELMDLYDGNVPKKILDKLEDPKNLEIIQEILRLQSNFSKLKLKEILENEKFIEALQKIDFHQIRKIIHNFLKITNKTKYVYFSSGIGLGLSGLIAGFVSLRWLRINAKTKKVVTSFKKSKYLSIFSALVSLIAIGGSIVLTLIFFILKGGF